MSAAAFRAARLAGVASTLALGGALLWSSKGAPLVGVLALGLTLVSLAATFASRKATRASTTSPPSAPVDAALDRIVDTVLGTMRKFLALHGSFARDLESVKAGLAQFPSREAVQDIVVQLMNANLEMEEKVSALSRELEESRQQILALRGDIAEVGKMAMLDALTQLGNRRYFDETLKSEIERARGTGKRLVLSLSDIDRFKSVNDRFGHQVGDQLLRLFAELLGRHVSSHYGHVARYGGEEFALLFPNVGIEEASIRVDAVRRELESKRWVVGAKSEKLGAITASFGVAELGPDESAESLLKRADDKLLEAKASGRNRVAIDSGHDSKTSREPMRISATASRV